MIFYSLKLLVITFCYEIKQNYLNMNAMADKLISFNRELQLVSYAIYLHENKTANIYAVQINSNIFPIIFINRAIKK